MDYLNNEDPFKVILNQEEINRIQSPQLREIRMKYWRLRHEAFIDERNISDRDLEKVLDELIRQEQEELQRFKNTNI
ncbi:hypothetical protein [Brevibacillus laterosporus]|uniref:hypothetical protein n=1 Tax=Brevibacillus laterosporus TaxID=1465 RepID=UPI000B9B55F7|nr:hypothetical protein [Brevibacillus laterosporus]MCG7317658.1 hypothetical protein [Brevibacillus laterosporus]